MSGIYNKDEVLKKVINARESFYRLKNLSADTKNLILKKLADSLRKRNQEILETNKIDLIKAEKSVDSGEMSKSLLSRLKLTERKIEDMAKSVESVANLPESAGILVEVVELDNNLELYKQTCPIGVIGAVFESRPDAVIQISSLCLKSGNAVILKGGSEAQNSNALLVNIFRNVIGEVDVSVKDAVQLIETREDVKTLLKLDSYIDLLVPRGSNQFIKYIQNNTKIPVLGHADGICHEYVDSEADIDMAVRICFDAKVQYPAVCNAMETLLVHSDSAEKFLPPMCEKFLSAGVELRGCKKTIEKLAAAGFNLRDMDMRYKGIKQAKEKDWKTEYLDMILSMKIVNSVNEAIEHINHYGSKHTDGIITNNEETANKFLSSVDSACVFWNASTRFSDGYRFGKGAEIGISTNKTHARGPVGLEGLVIYYYKLVGKGHIVADYTGENAKKFTHKKLKL